MLKSKDPTRWPWWGYGLLILAVIMWLAYKNNIGWISGQPAIDKQGQFGDMFGGFNTLLTAFGFVGLIISLHLQRKQFQASLDDMKGNAEAAEHQAKAMEAQTKALERSNEVNALQAEIACFSAQLNSEVAMYDTWERENPAPPASSGHYRVHLDERGKKRASIARLSKALQDTHTLRFKQH